MENDKEKEVEEETRVKDENDEMYAARCLHELNTRELFSIPPVLRPRTGLLCQPLMINEYATMVAR
jgi:hypothetical protein